MAVIRRREMLAGVVVVAAATVAGGLLLRKPPPPVLTLRPDAPPEPVRLQTMSALRVTDPPRPVGDLAFVDAAGTTHRLAEYAGRGVVLNLWATWCAPCVAELPALAVLAQTAGEKLVVLPLSSDAGGAAAVARFYRAHHLVGLPVVLDPKGADADAVGARGLPTTLIIDAAGRERARLEGAADWAAPDALAAIRRLAA